MNTTKKIVILFIICLFLITILAGCNLLKPIGDMINRGLGRDAQPPLPTTEEKMFDRMWWMLPLGALAFGAGMFLLVQKQIMIGLGIMASSIAVLLISVALIEKFQLIAWIGSGIFVLVVAFAVWQIWLNRKAFEQSVITLEEAKPEMDAQQLVTVFGPDEKDHGLAGKIQTKSTEKLIKKVRNKLKKGDSTND